MNQKPKPRPSPEEILEAIEEADADYEAERILGLTDEELDSEIAEAGFDPETVRARGREIGETIMREAAERQAAPAERVASTGKDSGSVGSVTKLPEPAKRKVRARWVVLLAAALAAIPLLLSMGDPGVGKSSPSDADEAAVLRKRALDECAAKAWRACLADLNAALTLDPKGEDEHIKAQRRRAQDAIAGGE
jgi:hypothetical protein